MQIIDNIEANRSTQQIQALIDTCLTAGTYVGLLNIYTAQHSFNFNPIDPLFVNILNRNVINSLYFFLLIVQGDPTPVPVAPSSPQ